ncbi:MAG: DNA polymerase III subunit, partial [Gemmatimonadetes bacterium]|nr:DNA polymerase III subunit [Gemmatimonadota bacterium]
MAFDRVIGHEQQRQRLMEAVKQDRLAHGYLFSGPSGVGAEALAIELACAVNCEYGPGEPCGQLGQPGQQNQHGPRGPCRHCRRIRALQHPDLHLLVPSSSTPPPDRSSGRGEGSSGRGEGSSGRANAREERRQGLAVRLAEDPYGAPPFGMNDMLSVEDVRSLRREASAKPYEGRRKVAIIVAADRMNAAASNALLKTLEEPPGSLMLILTASRSGRLLPTIVSRCQPVFLSRLREDEVKSSLIERYDVSPEEAGELARTSDGRLSEALAASSERGSKIREDAFALLECVN